MKYAVEVCNESEQWERVTTSESAIVAALIAVFVGEKTRVVEIEDGKD